MGYYMEGEFPTVVSGGGNNGGMWGSDGIWAILLLALLGNGGNFGFGGGRGGSEFVGYELGKVATQADVAAGFNNSAVLNNQNEIKLAMTQGFAGLNTVISQGLCDLGYNVQNGFNTLGHQISDCCCATQRLIERSTCDLLVNQNAQTQRIIDYLTGEKIESLRAENTALKGRISNNEQSAYIINALSPQARPAYIVPNPNCCYNSYGCGGTTITGVL